jgi:salicylate hydroxylase
MSRIDPLAETSWKFAWGYNVLESVEKAPGEVMGLTGLREGKHMTRPESQRAFELWKGCFTPADVAGGHDGMRLAYDRFLTSEFPPPEDAQVEEVETGGVPALRVTPAGGAAESGPVVLHFHGGGYMIGSARGSLEYAHRLAATVGGSCVTVDYRLAPEHPYPAALDDATDAYRGLLKEGVAPARILLSGESSGGGLALALALLLRTANDPLPAGIVVASPFTDLSLSGESIDRYSGDDPAANRDSLSFMAASYFQGHEPTDPYISPVFGDLAGLPPLFVTAVRDEVLASDAMRLIERARAAGVAVTEMLVKDSVHVFPVFPFLPETEEAMAGLRAWSRGLV